MSSAVTSIVNKALFHGKKTLYNFIGRYFKR